MLPYMFPNCWFWRIWSDGFACRSDGMEYPTETTPVAFKMVMEGDW